MFSAFSHLDDRKWCSGSQVLSARFGGELRPFTFTVMDYPVLLCIFKINCLWRSTSIFMLKLLFSSRFLPLGKYAMAFQERFL